MHIIAGVYIFVNTFFEFLFQSAKIPAALVTAAGIVLFGFPVLFDTVADSLHTHIYRAYRVSAEL